MNHPICITSKGLTIANFSSPHPFFFDDGTILDACGPELVEAGSLETEEFECPGPKGITDVNLRFRLTELVVQTLSDLELDDDVDIVLVPFPIAQLCDRDVFSKVRVVRMADRTRKLAHHDRFCVV